MSFHCFGQERIRDKTQPNYYNIEIPMCSLMSNFNFCPLGLFIFTFSPSLPSSLVPSSSVTCVSLFQCLFVLLFTSFHCGKVVLTKISVMMATSSSLSTAKFHHFQTKAQKRNKHPFAHSMIFSPIVHYFSHPPCMP